MKNKLVLIFILCVFLVLGCNQGNLSLRGSGSARTESDLSLLLSQSEAAEEDMSEGEPMDDEEYDFLADEPEQEPEGNPNTPEWARNLHHTVNASGSVKGKSGRKTFLNRPVSPDLIGEEVKEEEVEEEIVDIPSRLNTAILWIVDTSFSTRHVLRTMHRRLEGFVNILSPLNWRMGYISADLKRRHKGKYLSELELNGEIIINTKVISKRTRAYKQVFIDSLTRNAMHPCQNAPGCGSRKERPLAALNQFLKNDRHFIQDSEDLIVFILTDNNESKYRRGSMMTASQVVSTFYSKYGDDKRMKVYTLTVKDEECRSSIRQRSFTEGNYAPAVTQLAEATGGASFSLCLPSYAAAAETAVHNQLNPE